MTTTSRPSPESGALKTQLDGIRGRLAAHPDMDLQTQREGIEALSARAAEPVGVTYEEIEVDGRTAMWVRPLAARTDRVILYSHGGGYFTASMRTFRKLAGHVALAAGTLALVTDYPLAPEHPFPAQLDDALATYAWLLEQGFEPGNIALAGESAGGNLALATAVALRERGLPLPAAVVGFSPWLDLMGTGESFETNARSDAFLSRDISRAMAETFLAGAPDTDPLANPAHAGLGGLPPMHLSVGSEETLLSSVTAFAAAAHEAGVDVTLDVGAGMQHAWVWMAGRAPEADAEIAAAGTWLRHRMGRR